jgi:hypothetical protein
MNLDEQYEEETKRTPFITITDRWDKDIEVPTVEYIKWLKEQARSNANAGYVEPAETETLIKIINMLDKQISNAEWEMEILLVSEKPEELNYVKGKRQAYYITKRYIEKYCGKNSILSPEER